MTDKTNGNHDIFRTSDLPLAAYLDIAGVPLYQVVHEGNGHGVFEFVDESGREELVKGWYSGQDPIPSAQAFWQQVRLMKRRLEVEIANTKRT